MAAQTRHVDTVPAPTRNGHVEVINLGLSRTGTMSMYKALQKLGYKSYHMNEACLQTKNGHLTMWNEAIAAKYYSSSQAKYQSADFDKLLQNYDALTDIPCLLFVPELLEAYPNARLILTTHPRGAEAWLRSMENSYFRVSNWSIWPRLMMVYDTAFSLPYMTLIRRVMEIWTGIPWPAVSNFQTAKPKLEEFYSKHNDEMRRLAKESGRELLEFDPKKGWEPLCKFLGKEIPAEPYPHANEGNFIVNLHIIIILMRLRAVFGGAILKTAGVTAVAGIAWWWFGR